MTPEQKLAELGLELPVVGPAAGNYLPVVRTGNLLFCAGTLAVRAGEVTHAGQVGREQTIQTANVKAHVGELSAVKRIVMVNGFVNAVSGFADSPAVINGASDLLVAVFGDAGRHARAAVAVAGLPRNSATEVQLVIELRD